MAFCRLLFPLLVLSVVQIYAVEVPVFIWGDVSKSSFLSNPLTPVQKDEFDNILRDQLKDDAFTVIFIEETLSVDDFSRKNSNGKSSYPYLQQNIKHSVYVPSVKNPLKEIKSFADADESDHVQLTENGLSNEIRQDGSKFLHISLDDARESESRSDLLRRHNDFMEDTYGKLKQRYNDVVAIYTAHNPSWTIPVTHSRVRRQAEVSNSNDHRLDGLHIYAAAIKLQSQNDTTNLTEVTASKSEFGIGNMTTTLNFKEGALSLRFVEDRGYWFFDTVTVQMNNEAAEVLHPKTDDMYALLGYSYRCGQEIVFASINETKPYKLTFEDIQIQPFFGKVNSTDFGETFDCVGFFSVAIWSGLFVVFILLAIMAFGIMMMMDIRTMDRFDDPKGKTITINTAE